MRHELITHSHRGTLRLAAVWLGLWVGGQGEGGGGVTSEAEG